MERVPHDGPPIDPLDGVHDLGCRGESGGGSIDITRERPITLREAAALLPRARRGRKPHVATLYRWCQRGISGVRLDHLQVGGARCTSVEALQRFFETLTRRQAPSPQPGPETAAFRRCAAPMTPPHRPETAAARRLRALLYGPRPADGRVPHVGGGTDAGAGGRHVEAQ